MSDTFHAGLRDAIAEARRATDLRPRLIRPPLTALPPVHRGGRAPMPRPVDAAHLKIAHRTVVRLWLPLSPLWVLLSPFALLLAPLLWLAPAKVRVSPFRAVFAMGAALLAMSGTQVDVDTPDALVRIRIY